MRICNAGTARFSVSMIRNSTICGFQSINDVWMMLNDSKVCGFAIRIRSTAVCALRLKQDRQKNTALPMCPHLIALLDESDCGHLCMCSYGDRGNRVETNHIDVFHGGPMTAVDEAREEMARRSFLQNLHAGHVK